MWRARRGTRPSAMTNQMHASRHVLGMARTDQKHSQNSNEYRGDNNMRGLGDRDHITGDGSGPAKPWLVFIRKKHVTKEIEDEILQITGVDAVAWGKSRKRDTTIAIELGENRRMTSVLPSNLIDNWKNQFREMAVQAANARTGAGEKLKRAKTAAQ